MDVKCSGCYNTEVYANGFSRLYLVYWPYYDRLFKQLSVEFLVDHFAIMVYIINYILIYECMISSSHLSVISVSITFSRLIIQHSVMVTGQSSFSQIYNCLIFMKCRICGVHTTMSQGCHQGGCQHQHSHGYHIHGQRSHWQYTRCFTATLWHYSLDQV